jgi:hemoglobin
MAETPDDTTADERTLYERVGGLDFFRRLVDRFYDGIVDDPVLLPLYPEQDDLGPARRRLTLFLAQYWGGPTTYSEERGHPRLRARHFPYPIGTDEAARWLHCMTDAVDALGVPDPERSELLAYFDMAAPAMMNQQR